MSYIATRRAIFLFTLLLATNAYSQPPLKELVKGAADAWENGRHKQAIELLQQACAIAPQNADLRYNLGVMYLALGGPRLAQGEFEHALRIDPEHSDSLFNLGKLLIAQKKYDAGIARLEQAVATAPDNPTPKLEIVIAELHRSIDAAWKRALAIEPRSPEVQSMLSYLCLRRGRPKEALAYAQAAQLAEPSAQRHRLVLAQTHIALEQYSEALEFLEVAERNSEQPLANVPYLRGLISFLRLKFKDSQNYWTKAQSLAPKTFTQHLDTPDILVFPLASDSVYQGAMRAGGIQSAESDLFTQLTVGPGCHRLAIIDALFHAQPAVAACYRGGSTYDLNIRVRSRRIRSVQTQNKSRAERCIQRALRATPVKNTNKCEFQVRIGQSMVQ